MGQSLAAVEAWTDAAMTRLPGDQEHMVNALAAGIPINPEFATGMIRANFEPLMVAALAAAAELIVAATRRQVAEELRALPCCDPDCDLQCCCCDELRRAAAIALGTGETDTKEQK